MLMNLVAVFPCVSLGAMLLALAVLAVRWKHALRRSARLFLLGVLVLTLFHAASNVLEWANIATVLDLFEDYVELLLPVLWGCFVYVFLQGLSQHELRASEARYRSLTDDVLDTSAVAIQILDAQFRIVWINQASQSYFGLNRDECIGRDKRLLLHEKIKHAVENPEAFARQVTDAFDRHEPATFECHVLPGPTREERWLEYRGLPIPGGLYAGGRIEHYYDVTARKRAEQHREELLLKLETQNAELERFIYTVSHDLKTPLITIKGFLGILREELGEGIADVVEDALGRIDAASDKMMQLLNELLEMSRVGRVDVPWEDVPLADVVEEAVALARGSIDACGAEVHIDSGFPIVCGERPRLIEVFLNLIDNAAKYMGDQPRPRIEIGAETSDTNVVCYVGDNGIGIEPRFQGKVFELFEQLDPHQPGSGVGLALVKRIVEVHEGRVWVESEGPGCGTTVRFSLPARPA
ncbi:MAG: PAS domain-containing protein [Pirellulales bacterium]|nr:PAS domain-containing protein [Pirellulales bacterium]